MTGTYWISTTYATGGVYVDNDIIKDTPPVWRKFIGQRVTNLLDWLSKNNRILQFSRMGD